MSIVKGKHAVITGGSSGIGLAVALAFAVLRSVVLTMARGGVRWRGTFYPLAELKAGLA